MKLRLTIQTIYGEQLFTIESSAQCPVDPTKSYLLTAQVPAIHDRVLKAVREQEEKYSWKYAPPEDIFPFLRFQCELLPDA